MPSVLAVAVGEEEETALIEGTPAERYRCGWGSGPALQPQNSALKRRRDDMVEDARPHAPAWLFGQGEIVWVVRHADPATAFAVRLVDDVMFALLP